MQPKTAVITEKIPAFDLLRSIMVISLVAFHAAISFMVTEPDPEVWTYKSSSTNLFFDTLISTVHSFRHPLFFIISGFVTEQMYVRYSSTEVIKKRLTRIGIPLLVIIIFISPFIYGIMALINGQVDIYNLQVLFPANDVLFGVSTTYGWFLYYLLLYNLIHLGLKRSFIKSEKLSEKSTNTKFTLALIILFILTFTSLYLWKENTLFGQYSLTPHIGSVGGYGLYYLFGIHFYRHHKLYFTNIKKFKWWFTIIGLIALNTSFVFALNELESGISAFDFDFPLMIISTCASILLSFGILGLSLEYYLKPNKTISYISRHSYSIYLIHFPVLLLILLVISKLNMNAFGSFAVIFSLTFFLTLILNEIRNRISQIIKFSSAKKSEPKTTL